MDKENAILPEVPQVNTNIIRLSEDVKSMSSHEDDLFDSIIFLEENCEKQGYLDGFNEGKLKGWNQGKETGWTQGKLIGNEVGFYKGFVQTWLACSKEKKVIVKLEALSKVLDQDWSDTSQDLTMKLQLIRAKFKQICSMLNVNIEKTETTHQLSF